MNNTFVKAALAIAFASTLALAVDVTNVQARQRWPWSGKVDIYYTLVSDNTNGTFNISFDCLDGETPVIMKAYSGDGATGTTTGIGTKVLTWDASIDYDGVFSSAVTFGITATEVVPDNTYMKVNLNNGEVTFQDNAPAEWTSADKSDYLWLRKIPAGTFMMGSSSVETQRYEDEGQHQVTLTKDFYIGVFQLTRDQYNKIDTDASYHPDFSNPTQPGGALAANNLCYDDLRGASDGATWPTYTDHRVDSASFLGLLRAKCGGEYAFDLPTEAQWEYACRGPLGTDGKWNDGSAVQNSDTDSNLDNLGWYLNNAENVVHEVGQKTPNSYGLYDMHGNVLEWCLDWYQDDITSMTTDPAGGETGECRMLRGGSWYDNAKYCRSASRAYYDYPEEGYENEGARVALTLE